MPSTTPIVYNSGMFPRKSTITIRHLLLIALCFLSAGCYKVHRVRGIWTPHYPGCFDRSSYIVNGRYEAPQDRQDAILKSYSLLRTRMEMPEVTLLLGAPDDEHPRNTKEGKIFGYSHTYILSNGSLLDYHDPESRVVVLDYSLNNRLTRAKPYHIDGLKTLDIYFENAMQNHLWENPSGPIRLRIRQPAGETGDSAQGEDVILSMDSYRKLRARLTSAEHVDDDRYMSIPIGNELVVKNGDCWSQVEFLFDVTGAKNLAPKLPMHCMILKHWNGHHYFEYRYFSLSEPINLNEILDLNRE